MSCQHSTVDLTRSCGVLYYILTPSFSFKVSQFVILDCVSARMFTKKTLHILGIKRSKVKEIIVLIKARSFLDELNLEHLTS